VSAEPDRVERVETETPVADESARVAAAEKALQEALAERNRLWAELNEQRAEQRELEYLRGELAMIRGSRMWKLAGHYQRVKALARVGLKRLRQG
jgi:hypothetical protein